MTIVWRLDRIMADRKIRLKDLSKDVGITPANLSHIKTNKSTAVRFTTLDALCETLKCQPADLLEHLPREEQEAGE